MPYSSFFTRRQWLTSGRFLPLLLPFQSRAAEVPAAHAPSRIILTWSGDPTRSQSVTWRTESPADHPQAQIAPLSSNPKISDGLATVAAKGQVVALPGGKSAAHYVAHFQGLEPATRYNYRVGDGKNWSEWNVFRTAANRPEPFRFLYLGDAQNDIHSLWSRAIRSAYAAAPDSRLVVHAGDLVNTGHDDQLWAEFCEAQSFISAMLPSLPVPGNHDLKHDSGDTEARHIAAKPWARHFALPANGPQALAGQSYFTDYQGVRFIALDVNVLSAQKPEEEEIARQLLDWLQQVLTGNPNRWTIVVQHQPVYSIANNRKAGDWLERLVPIYDKFNVDLVLAGHDHGYARTHKLRGGRVVSADQPGTIYAVSVSGPKMYKVNPATPELLATTRQNSQLYQVISVDHDRILFEAFTLEGASIDRVELRKPRA
jgi:3',5'-cyclic AMP phosphodiesterase CpdA